MQITSPSCTESPTATSTSWTVYFSSVVTVDTSALSTVPVALTTSSRLPRLRVTVRTYSMVWPVAAGRARSFQTARPPASTTRIASAINSFL